MGAFDGARTHDWQASTVYESDVLPTAPDRPSIGYNILLFNMNIVNELVKSGLSYNIEFI